MLYHAYVHCTLVTCSSLTNPNNGVISCSLGGDNVSLYEDTCSFTCNTGYELTGSDTRTCQSNGSWSGSGDVCRRGTLMQYYSLTINCVHTSHLSFTLGN